MMHRNIGIEDRVFPEVSPVHGRLSEWIDEVFPPETECPPDVAIDRAAMAMIDGAVALVPGSNITIVQGFFGFSAPGEALEGNGPCVGLKIHVYLDSTSPDYVNRIGQVARLCAGLEGEQSPTSFKVMFVGTQNYFSANGIEQGRKVVTIYPRYVDGEGTNVAETVRLVSGLREILGEVEVPEGFSIYGERSCGHGIFIRAGELTEPGRRYALVPSTSPFEQQLVCNLNSPQTDGAAFVTQVRDAIENGLL